MSLRILFLSISVGLSAHGGNWGHRGGGGAKGKISELAENSLPALEAVLWGWNGKAPLQDHRKFRYLEVDIQETADHEIVLFHDEDSITRTLAGRAANRNRLEELSLSVSGRLGKDVGPGELRVENLYLEELQSLVLRGKIPAHIPELEEYLDAAVSGGLRKPLVLEIKSIWSETGRERLFEILEFFWIRLHDLVMEYVQGLHFDGPLNLIAFSGNFRKSYGERGSELRLFWCRRFRDLGLPGVFKPIFHRSNQCPDGVN